MFFAVSQSNICNFDNDNTSSCGESLGNMLPRDSPQELVFVAWSQVWFKAYFQKMFQVNLLKPDPGKIHFMILATYADLFLDGNKIEKSQKVLRHWVTIDNKLSFNTHLENICWAEKYKQNKIIPYTDVFLWIFWNF